MKKAKTLRRCKKLCGFPYRGCFPCEEERNPHIEMQLEGFTEAALGNLEKLIIANATLIKKVLGANTLPIDRMEITHRFPWLNADTLLEEVQAYFASIARLCAAAEEQKWVTASCV